MDFEKKAPKWDAAGAEPSADLQENGFMAGYKPPAAYFNYLFNRIVAAIKEIQTKLSNVDNTADSEKPVSTAQATAIADAKAAGTNAQTNITNHTGNKSNPHGVTKSQVGLGNVPNVATNDQTPTYTAASSNANLTSGEKLSVAMGKIAKAVNSLISHLNNTSNPHSVTKSQVGLGNVPNVATNDQTPTYSDTSTLATLSSGEKLNVAMQKIKLAITTLINHVGNKSNPHGVTAKQAGALPISGGELTGYLTVIDNFNVNKTFNGVEYKTYARPINYSIGNNGDYSTGLIHYKEDVNQAQLMFNKDGVMLRDNVNAKAYKLFGQHNTGDAPFLQTTGGTLGGQLGINGGYGSLEAYDVNFSFRTRNVEGNDTNSRRITLSNSKNKTLKDCLTIADTVDGTTNGLLILGQHNKPSGSYTGNNSDTSRTVAVGGLGENLVITSDKGTAWVSSRGAICMDRQTGTISALKSWEVYYKNETLTIATNSAFVNGAMSYWYQVL